MCDRGTSKRGTQLLCGSKRYLESMSQGRLGRDERAVAVGVAVIVAVTGEVVI